MAPDETPESPQSILVVRTPLTRDDLRAIAARQFGDFVKAVVDVRQGWMAVGGELHSDEESVLLAEGSRQSDLWGINLYPELGVTEWIEFDSMINLRPAQGNRSRGVDDPKMQSAILAVVQVLVQDTL